MKIATAQVNEGYLEQPGRPPATDTVSVPLEPSAVRAVDILEERSTVPRDKDGHSNDIRSLIRSIDALRPHFPKIPVPREFFVALQRWEGYVETVGDETFVARLVDLGGRLPEEEAEFFIADVSDEDLDLLRSGSVFYWSVGYRLSSTRQRSKVSMLRFRRLPRWSDRDIERVRLETERILKTFDD